MDVAQRDLAFTLLYIMQCPGQSANSLARYWAKTGNIAGISFPSLAMVLLRTGNRIR